MIDVRHTLVSGATRSGKSEAELSRLFREARAGDRAIALFDPPGTLARKLLIHLDVAGLTGRVVYDRLCDTDRVPSYDWLVRSSNPDPLQREAEDDERIREFASVLLRRRNILDTASRPLIEETILAALRLYLSQDTPPPISWIADAFDIRSKHRWHLLAHCTSPDIANKFRELGSLSPTARRTETGPAERILRAVLGSPAFRVRSADGTLDLGKFLDDNGILIVDGSSHGNLSRDAATVMMGALILRVITHGRTGAKRRVSIVIDEAAAANLVGLYESQALAEAGKWGLEFRILVQDPFGFSTPEVRSNVLQNCWRHEWFRQGSPEAARLAAEDIATPLLNPHRVHHIESRPRTVIEGFDRVTTHGSSVSRDSRGRKSKTRSRSTVLWPRRREILDAQQHYMSLPDQISLAQSELMRLSPGYRYVRDDACTPIPEYVPMLTDPWTGEGDMPPELAGLKFRSALAAIRSGIRYRTAARASNGTESIEPGAAARLRSF